MRTVILYAALWLIFVVSLAEARRAKNDQSKDRVSKGKNSKVRNKQSKNKKVSYRSFVLYNEKFTPHRRSIIEASKEISKT